MKIIYPALIFILLLLAACGSAGDVFFVRNYSDKPVSFEYRLHESGQYEDTFYYQPPDTALLSERILRKKEFYPFWKAPFVYYNQTLDISEIDSLNYVLTIPAGSTIRIGPVYRYSDNISRVIINESDTIITDTEEFLYYHKDLHRVRYRPKLMGDSYFLLDLYKQ